MSKTYALSLFGFAQLTNLLFKETNVRWLDEETPPSSEEIYNFIKSMLISLIREKDSKFVESGHIKVERLKKGTKVSTTVKGHKISITFPISIGNLAFQLQKYATPKQAFYSV